MRVAVVSEYYPSKNDPVLGIWAHRQTIATQAAGAEVVVLALRRPIPPLATLRQGIKPALKTTGQLLREPRQQTIDGVNVISVPFLSPPRPHSYDLWGAYAAPFLAVALRKLQRHFPFDVIHAHNAIPAGDAVRRARLRTTPLVVSVHGGDIFYTAQQFRHGAKRVTNTFHAADRILANSAAISRSIVELGAEQHNVETVHLGAPIPPQPTRTDGPPTLVTLAHLIPRKRHTDVLHAMHLLKDRWPTLRYHIIGDGPTRSELEHTTQTLGLQKQVTFFGQLPHDQAVKTAQAGTIFVLPSVDEAFGVAYIEAMAGGLPAIGIKNEAGPAEICAQGEGLIGVPANSPQAIAATIENLLQNPTELHQLGDQARATVTRAFSWQQCGQTTLAAYEKVLR